MLAAIEWAIRPDGFLHLVQDGHDLVRGPLGVLVYLPLVPLYWVIAPKHRSAYLILSSLLLALITLGHGYMLTVAALAIAAFLVVRSCGQLQLVRTGASFITALYILLIMFPQPAWLPRVEKPAPLYFYLHWAGLAYLYIKSMHVLLDVGRRQLPMPLMGEFSAYMLFAPTLRMGPIYRYPQFLEQLHRDPKLHRNFGAGAIRIVLGFVRLGVMAVLADKGHVKYLFEDPTSLTGGELAGSLYAAAISVYLWISAYVDMSIGIGHILGFNIPENFNYPWRATSLADFWRRWHLTLGSWLRDYIYIPLGGNRRHVYANYLITFLFCGLWHGLYLSYIFWGLSQGIGLAAGRAWNSFWTRHAQRQSPLFQQVKRFGLINSPISVASAWVLTFNYQIITIAWFMDEKYAGRLIGRRILALFGLN